ncbi:MAG: hypothetical protein AB8B99_08115 [Phormidesmis sp.]
MKRQIFVASVLSVAGCLAAVSKANAVEFVFTNMQVRSGEVIEQEQRVVENFRVLQQESAERKRRAAKEAASAGDHSAIAQSSNPVSSAEPAASGNGTALSTTPVSIEEEGFNIFSEEN